MLTEEGGFEFEETKQDTPFQAENGMSIHQRLAARISKHDESYGRDALLQAVLMAEARDKATPNHDKPATGLKRDRL
jgi:hypothetical protein